MRYSNMVCPTKCIMLVLPQVRAWVSYWLGSDASEIASVAVDLLKRHQHANILYRGDVLLGFANGFLGHFLNTETLPKIGNRVSVSITRVPSIKNIMVNTFHDLSDLSAAVRASCHIPSRQMRTVRFRHMRCMDGGFSNNSPILTPRTLRVSPFFFDARADIFPAPKVAPWWAIKAALTRLGNYSKPVRKTP